MNTTTKTETPEPECSDCGHDYDDVGRCWCPLDSDELQDRLRAFMAGGAS